MTTHAKAEPRFTRENTQRMSGETDKDWAERIRRANRTPEESAKERAARKVEKERAAARR